MGLIAADCINGHCINVKYLIFFFTAALFWLGAGAGGKLLLVV